MAFSWDGAGRHYGVLAQRRGEKVQIVRAWHEEASEKASHGEVLARGIQALDGGRDMALIVGGHVSRAFFHELVMPAMSSENLLRAIEFEIDKITPMQVGDITWLYRDVGPTGDQQRRLRIVCVPTEEWQSWLDGASGLGQGVDMVLPAGAALDPVLAERPVCLTTGDDGGCYLFEPKDGGSRRVRYAASAMELQGAFGAGPEPLADERLMLGPLAKLEVDDARGYASAVILGMYGVSKSFGSDRRQVRGIPRTLRPRRNFMLKAMAALLMAFLIVGVLFGALRGLYQRSSEVAALRQYQQRLIKEASQYNVKGDNDLRVVEVQNALMQAILSRRSITEALVEITTTLDDRVHARRLSWSDGKVSLHVTSSSDSPDVLLALSQSEFFSDYSLVKRENIGGVVTFDIDLLQKDYRTRGNELLARQRGDGGPARLEDDRPPAPRPRQTSPRNAVRDPLLDMDMGTRMPQGDPFSMPGTFGTLPPPIPGGGGGLDLQSAPLLVPEREKRPGLLNQESRDGARQGRNGLDEQQEE